MVEVTNSKAAFFAGFATATILALSLFSYAQFQGIIARGDVIQDISDMLPPVVAEMPTGKNRS